MKLTDVSNLPKISSLMDEEKYWKIIAHSLKKSEDQDEQEEVLIAQIAKLSPQEIIEFDRRTTQLTGDIYTSEMWCAAYIVNGGCSDDGFLYFRNWVVSRGKNVYYAAKENPDSLLAELEEFALFEFEFEQFMYLPAQVFEEKTGKEMYEYMAEPTESYTDLDLNWNEDEPETMEAICPNLYDLFRGEDEDDE